MKVILVAGGSGGHIYPCLELAKYFKSKGDEVLLIGATNSMEEKIYMDSGLNYLLLNINKKKLKSLVFNYKKIDQIYKDYNPDALILFGNYISFSFALVAFKNKIPIYLHEQNIVYGRANKLIGLMAKRVYLSLPIEKDIYKKKSLLVGNPKADLNDTIKVKLDKKRKNIFIVMGSLGSESVNASLLELTKNLNTNYNYHIVTGKKHYESFNSKIHKKSNLFVYQYLNSLISYLKEADLVISRSGATTLLEIINYNIPSILIPSPYVKDNHQYKNAKYLTDQNGALLLEEKNLSASSLKNSIEEILNDNKRIKKIKENLINLSYSNSRELIYNDISSYEK